MSAMPTCKHMISAEDFPKAVAVSVGPPSCPWCEVDRLRAMLLEIREAMENDYGWGSTIKAIDAELALGHQQIADVSKEDCT